MSSTLAWFSCRRRRFPRWCSSAELLEPRCAPPRPAWSGTRASLLFGGGWMMGTSATRRLLKETQREAWPPPRLSSSEGLSSSEDLAVLSLIDLSGDWQRVPPGPRGSSLVSSSRPTMSSAPASDVHVVELDEPCSGLNLCGSSTPPRGANLVLSGDSGRNAFFSERLWSSASACSDSGSTGSSASADRPRAETRQRRLCKRAACTQPNSPRRR
mmetsp:Transcript_58179/g.149775  ORF Transcript_58179/g.149775 Transcript_58179/m.149775 type:complete len:214 (+) Transcript_58179:388-1029(+)